MSDDEQVTALLTQVAERGDTSTPPPIATLVRRARNRRRALRVVLGTAIAAIVGIVAIAAISRGIGRSPRVAAGPVDNGTAADGPTAGSGGVFDAPTGDALVFDDGYSGVVTIDLDHRTVSRRSIDGQRAGDQPWRLTAEGPDLIVGWGQVYAAPLAGGPSVLLDGSAISFPAVEPGRVWLVTYPGGATGEGPATVWEVTTAGRTIIPAKTPGLNVGYPVVGTPGGMAFENTNGVISMWDATTGAVTQTVGSGQTEMGLPDASNFAWCDGTCAELHVTAFGGGDRPVALPAGLSKWEAYTSQFSPDGRYLAVVAAGPGPSGNTQAGAVIIVDTATGMSQVVSRGVLATASVTWAPDGSRLFFASLPATAPTTPEVIIGEFDQNAGRTETATVPAAVEDDVLALPRHDASALIATHLGSAGDCQTPLDASPGNSDGLCGYRF